MYLFFFFPFKGMGVPFLSKTYPPDNISASLSTLKSLTFRSCPLFWKLASPVVHSAEFTSLLFLQLLCWKASLFLFNTGSKNLPSAAFFSWYFLFITDLIDSFVLNFYFFLGIPKSPLPAPNLLPRDGHFKASKLKANIIKCLQYSLLLMRLPLHPGTKPHSPFSPCPPSPPHIP